MQSRNWTRLVFAVCAVAVALTVSPAAARHHGHRAPWLYQARLEGEVTQVDGPAGVPTGFVLTMPFGRSVDVKIAPRTTFTARSAEALVDGFVAGDFAVVSLGTAPRPVAQHVTYDVIPFGPIRRFKVTGTLAKVAPAGDRYQLRLTGGALHWIVITNRTRFEVGGLMASVPVNPQRGALIAATVRRAGPRWIALVIDVRTPTSG